MPATPHITLTATLDDLTGAAAGSTANPAKLRIALCGFGPVLPLIAGAAILAKTGPFAVYSTGGPISVPLWANDQITPNTTFYSIEVLDGEDNVVQCGMYKFTGSGTIDLSNAIQLVPPYGFTLGALAVAATSAIVPGTIFQSPGLVVGVYYNGILQRPGIDYTMSGAGTIINLAFTIEPGDNIYALCVQS